MDESTAYVFYLVIGPFLLCFLLQYGAERVKHPTLRRALSLPLPLLSGGALLFSLYKTAAVTGWELLGWTVLDCIAGSVLAGAGLGRLLARNGQKK